MTYVLTYTRAGVCVLCKTPYVARSPKRKFCSDLCQERSTREKRTAYFQGRVALKAAYDRVYLKENAARIRERDRQWRNAHRGQWQLKKRLEYHRNKDAHRKRAKRYDLNHPEVRLVADAKRRSREMASGGAVTRADWLDVLAKYGRKCFYCGVEGRVDMDHRLPLSRGGEHTPSNIVPACRHCNSSKGARTEDEFRAYKLTRGF